MTPFPLVLLHHAGGSAGVFDALVKALPSQIQAVVLELPGRGRRWREDLFITADDAVDDLARAVDSLGHREFAVFGHSLGAYLGLGLASRLEEKSGVRCTTLFASANAGPVGAVLPFDGSPLLTTDEEILAIAAHFGGELAPQVLKNSQLRRRTADLLRADFALSDSFLNKQQRTVTEADIVVCCGTQDVFTEAQLEQWRLSSTADTEVIRFDGGHFYLEREVGELAEAIVSRLPARSR